MFEAGGSKLEWKYVNVRGLFVFLEPSIDRCTRWAVFEPNNRQIASRHVRLYALDCLPRRRSIQLGAART